MSKTILITGATDGIGLLTAKMLTQQGHTVVLHGRSANKLDAAATEVGGTPDTIVADLSKLDDVKAMASDLVSRYKTIDVLINNAGVLKAPDTSTEQGWDLRFMVNTFAPYLLTRKLLPLIPSDGRVINLSSAALAPFDQSVMLGETKLADDLAVYAQSKLGITIWSQQMAAELANGPVLVAVNPGSLLATKMVKEGFNMDGNDLSIGANILIKAALDDSFANASGKYFDNDAGQFNAPQAAASDPAHCKLVMQTLDNLLKDA
jgi:NAD(P)-dependent dehydrogenase (short-subunit alcohol dehydrogenase family)